MRAEHADEPVLLAEHLDAVAGEPSHDLPRPPEAGHRIADVLRLVDAGRREQLRAVRAACAPPGLARSRQVARPVADVPHQHRAIQQRTGSALGHGRGVARLVQEHVLHHQRAVPQLVRIPEVRDVRSSHKSLTSPHR